MSFRYKFLLTFITIETIFVVMIVLFNFASINKTSETLIDEQLESSSLFVKAPLLVNDLATIDDAAYNFSTLKNIVKVMILNRDKVVLSDAVQPSFVEANPEAYQRLNDILMAESVTAAGKKIEIGQNTYLHFSKSIMLEGTPLGELRFIYDASQVLQTIAYNKEVTLFILLVELVLSVVVAFVLGYQITHGLNRLTRISEKISNINPSI